MFGTVEDSTDIFWLHLILVIGVQLSMDWWLPWLPWLPHPVRRLLRPRLTSLNSFGLSSAMAPKLEHKFMHDMSILSILAGEIGEIPLKSHFVLVKHGWTSVKGSTRNRLPCSFSLKLMLRQVELGAAWLGALAFQKEQQPEVLSDKGPIVLGRCRFSMIFIDL